MHFWYFFWASGFALAWLFPNHYPPWLSFFSDAWSSGLAIALGATVIAFQKAIQVSRLATITLICSLIPWAQYAAGMLPSIGVVWVYSLFILGLALSLIVGFNSDVARPSKLINALFFVITGAALLSVGLQVYQLLQGSHLGMLVMWNDSSRPSANLGQPNQLATLYLWSLVSLLWAIEKSVCRGPIVALAALVILFGIALTGSRTAWVGMLILWIGVVLYRKHWRHHRLPVGATLLFLSFLLWVWAISLVGPLNTWLFPGGALSGTTSSTLLADSRFAMEAFTGDSRLKVWSALLDAIYHRPWAGYGFGQISQAQLSVAMDHGAVGKVFSYAHNLILDLVLWMGLPQALLLVCGMGYWLMYIHKRLKSGEDVILFFAILVIGNHALLEMPLYYAYFLLPLGLLVGTLESRVKANTVFTLQRSQCVPATLIVLALWLGLIRDYRLVESAFNRLELKWQSIQTSSAPEVPDLWLLTQWNTYFGSIYAAPKAGMTADEIRAIEEGLRTYPTMVSFDLLASSLALNERPQEAREWLVRACKVGDCSSLKGAWIYRQERDPRYVKVQWPKE